MLPLATPPAPPRHPALVAAADWSDWRWQLRNMMQRADELASFIDVTSAERDALAASAHLFKVGVTPYYASLMDRTNPSCPIRMQALPRMAELEIRDEELRDPLGEDAHMPAPSVVHKYPDRALLLVVDRCGIYCRHCNRRRLVAGETPPTASDIDAGIAYIAKTRRIRDVLISGGDPFLLPTAKLESILQKLAAIPHLDFIRIGTRMPVVCPMRIDDELCAMLRKYHPVYVNTHFNHAKELTPLAKAACERLVDAGIPVGNQAVVLRGINSSVRSLRALMRGLLRMRVRPYYLFHGDTVIGTDHLRTTVATSQALYRGLRGFMTGMGVPHLVLDAPGGGGKVPIIPNYIVEQGDSTVVVENYRGERIAFPEPLQRDAQVPYDEIFFSGMDADDDREGASERDDA
ncbi:MAG: KamA family radical SAM protein [Myxococcales bacterium]|nr:KamA family radical SAM protein [Myxococcales bacterium]